jgi:hypothetical protein
MARGEKMMLTDDEYENFYKESMEIAVRMQDVLKEDDDAIQIGVAAQKIATFCAIDSGMNLGEYLTSCAYSFKATQAEKERLKRQAK